MRKLTVLAAVLLGVLSFAAPAQARNPKHDVPTGTISAPIGDTVHGGSITFDVTATSTYYSVEVDCSQAGVVVYQSAKPYYNGAAEFYLGSINWTSGAADCVATLSALREDGVTTPLASVAFAVTG